MSARQLKFLKKIEGLQLKRSIYLNKIKKWHVGVINIYKLLYSFCKIFNIFIDMAKISFKVYYFFIVLTKENN